MIGVKLNARHPHVTSAYISPLGKMALMRRKAALTLTYAPLLIAMVYMVVTVQSMHSGDPRYNEHQSFCAILLVGTCFWMLFACVARATSSSRARLNDALPQAIGGHCPRCGYDLCVTPDSCPECGTRIWTRTATGVFVNRKRR